MSIATLSKGWELCWVFKGAHACADDIREHAAFDTTVTPFLHVSLLTWPSRNDY